MNLLFYCNEGFAFVKEPVKKHDKDLHEEEHDHLTRKLVIGNGISNIGDISAHFCVEENQEQTDEELNGKSQRVKVNTRLLLLKTWEKALKEMIFIYY
jgi:hypothetical protein